MIHIYTGEGGGKTTAALGLALRAVGHNKEVYIIQFMKGMKEIGEYTIRERLGKNYHIHQFGRKGFVDLNNPSEEDKELAKKGLDFAKNCLDNSDVLVLDEVCYAIEFNLLEENEVVEFLKEIPKEKWVILTGRHASKKICEISDFITEFKTLKEPGKIHSQEGIEW